MSTDARAILGRRVAVEVPATIANLGAGYDCLGLAVDLPLHVAVEAVEARSMGQAAGTGVELAVEGEGAGALMAERSNRLVTALDLTLAELGVEQGSVLGWRITMQNPIPLERGLGSSAAAAVAGVVAAASLAEQPLAWQAALQIATRIEGHPDNVAPALLGGLVASVAARDGVEAIRLEPPDLELIAWIPDRRLSTQDMRQVLPEMVPRADALANLARVAVGVAGLATGRLDVVALLTEDRLHEPYRAEVYPELPLLRTAAVEAGAIGACLAGAGSAVVAFAAPSTAADVAARFGAAASAIIHGRLARLPLRREGAVVR